MEINILNQKLYEEENSFNVIFRQDGKMVAIGEKREYGLAFPMIRMYKGAQVQDLKNSKAELISRLFDVVVATAEIDNLTLNSSYGFLHANGRLF